MEQGEYDCVSVSALFLCGHLWYLLGKYPLWLLVNTGVARGDCRSTLGAWANLANEELAKVVGLPTRLFIRCNANTWAPSPAASQRCCQI